MSFLAEVVFYAGQRRCLPGKGYRPDAIFNGFQDYWGITFTDLTAKQFNIPVLAAIEFTYQERHYQEIVPDQSFRIMEGPRQVGEGKVLFVEKQN